MQQPELPFAALEPDDEFIRRHIGTTPEEQEKMLAVLGVDSMDALIDQVVPEGIRDRAPLKIPPSASEATVLDELRAIGDRNQVLRTLIGQGYYNTHTPSVIQRNILENPGWYTAYTPYQPEISQGRLEALLNFQTMVADLTGMEIANASMLDEATAAAEAMTLARRAAKSKGNQFFVSADCLPQTIDVVRTRAEPLGIEVVVGDHRTDLDGLDCFGALVQYPGCGGDVADFAALCETIHAGRGLVVAAADLLALTLLTPPGEWGADIAVGTTQRFGVPLGFGGPHAGYLAAHDAIKRSLPGRLVGLSIDVHGNPTYRLALQTREQHIRREKATSNICTAQVLLAVMASMYAVYHGPDGLRRIAYRVHRLTATLATGLRELGVTVANEHFFDTLTLETGARTAAIHAAAVAAGFNLRHIDDARLGLSLDETVTTDEVERLWALFADGPVPAFDEVEGRTADALPDRLLRDTEFLTAQPFQRYHSETDMMRYLRLLADRDIALDRAMIPLGSCTMKLNAATEMRPVSWPQFAAMHPFVPADQAQGYRQLIDELEQMLAEVTGYAAVSLQPNAGSQGEYAGLLAIRGYHRSRGDQHRNVCLIPSSAHGTNPASAQMVGLRVVVVACDGDGNIDLDDLRAKAEKHRDELAAIMITYPSTHGVFEASVVEVCAIVHDHGGQVYIDGANMNAQVGLCKPGRFGGDVSHLNLHKTFAIPHGGGGPGVGPIGVAAQLVPFLPGHGQLDGGKALIGPVSAAPFGSPGVLPISWTYLRLLGYQGQRMASEAAILAANYVATRLAPHYPVLYTGPGGRVAHECILDLRPLKESSGVTVDDVAKRLMDFGFHAPTMSFPVPGTLMVEPTESESKVELDRFCTAMIAIREEIRAVESGAMAVELSPLRHAPHTAASLLGDAWDRPYSREQAAYPVAALRNDKYWPPVGRVDNVYGDRNLVCGCPSTDEYSENGD